MRCGGCGRRWGDAARRVARRSGAARGAKSKAAAARRGMSVKQKASFVFKRRCLIVKRRENLGEIEGDDLKQMLEYLPGLATPRRFADRTYWLFDTPKDFHQVSCRRAAIVGDEAFLGVPELVKALEQVRDEKFAKLMAYLRNPVSRRVRTNNHVERTNRMFRLLEKVRYKWRWRKTLVRFVALTLDGIWRALGAERVDKAIPPVPGQNGETQSHTGKRSRQVA